MKNLATKRHKKHKWISNIHLRFLCLLVACFVSFPSAFPQTKSGSHSTRKPALMSTEAKALVEEAIGIVCTQAKLDPQSSVAIDEMQARPSLPVQSPEARAGAERAQRLLPVAKSLVAKSLRQLAAEYGLDKSAKFKA